MVTIYQPRDIGAELGENLSSPFAKALLGGLQQKTQDEFAMNKLDAEQKFRMKELQKQFDLNNALQEARFKHEKGLETEKTKQKEAEFNTKRTANEVIIRDLETRRNLPPGSLNAYIDNPKTAEKITRPQSDKLSTTIPLTDEQQQIVNEITEKANKNDWTESQFVNALSQKKIPLSHGQILGKSYGESQERGYQRQKDLDVAYKPDIENARLGLEAANKRLGAIKLMRPAIEKQQTGQFTNLQTFAAGLGIEGLWSPEQAMLATGQKEYLSGLRSDIFTRGLTNFETGIALGMTPNLLKSPEANKVLLNFQEKEAELEKAKDEILLDLYRKNKGHVYPEIFDDQQRIYEEKYGKEADAARDNFIKEAEKYQDPNALFNILAPNGKIYPTPAKDIERALNEGGKLL